MRSKMMHVFSRAAVAGTAATCVLVAGSIALAPTASASTAATSQEAPSPCLPGNFCFYSDINFQGESFIQKISSNFPGIDDFGPGLLFQNGSLTLNDNVSSIVNNSNREFVVFADPDEMGNRANVEPGESIRDLQGLNDAISSFHRAS